LGLNSNCKHLKEQRDWALECSSSNLVNKQIYALVPYLSPEDEVPSQRDGVGAFTNN